MQEQPEGDRQDANIARKDNTIIKFYMGLEPDDMGRSFSSILECDNAWLEESHDYIQWLFPLPEPSPHNRDAPLLTDEVAMYMRSNNECRSQVLLAVRRMLRFYGFEMELCSSIRPLYVRPADDFQVRAEDWATPYNHNFRRITRILRFVTLIGMEEVAQVICDSMCAVPGVDENTKAFWRSPSENLGKPRISLMQVLCAEVENSAKKRGIDS